MYVPGESFEEDLFLITSGGRHPRIAVGEPLVLHAGRRSAPWLAIDGRDLEPDQCWLPSLPPQLEAEVAGSVRWLIEPSGHASFNTDLREDGSREVRFDSVGAYRLTAESSSWCGEPFSGDTLTIDVVE